MGVTYFQKAHDGIIAAMVCTKENLVTASIASIKVVGVVMGGCGHESVFVFLLVLGPSDSK